MTDDSFMQEVIDWSQFNDDLPQHEQTILEHDAIEKSAETPVLTTENLGTEHPNDDDSDDIWSPLASPSSDIEEVETPLSSDHDQGQRCNDVEGVDYPFREYELRPQTRCHKPTFATTWYDKDSSGNYGDKPTAAERRLQRVKRAGAKRRKVEVLKCSGDDQKRPASEDQEADSENRRRKVPSLFVKLYLLGEKTQAEVTEILSKEPAHTGRSLCGEGHLPSRRSAVRRKSHYYLKHTLSLDHYARVDMPAIWRSMSCGSFDLLTTLQGRRTGQPVTLSRLA